MKCILLAAGTSGRILSVSKGYPKPLIKIKKKTIIRRNIDWLYRYNITKIFVNLFFKPKLIVNEIKKIKKNINFTFSLEKKLLGTAGAVKNIEKKLGKSFLVIYSDNLLNFDIEKFINFHKEKKSDLSIALYSPDVNFFSGLASSNISINKKNKIINFKEKRNKNSKKNKYVNTGAYIVNSSILKKIPQKTFYDFSSDLFPQLVNKNFYGYVIEKKGYCLGIDTPETYKKSLKIIKKNRLF